MNLHKNRLAIVILILLTVITSYGILLSRVAHHPKNTRQVTNNPSATSVASTAKGSSSSFPINLTNPKGSLTILLLGVDKRPDDNSWGNSDTIIAAHIDPSHNRVEFLSVPRDTQIILPKYNKQKINAVARLESGPESTVRTVEQLLGQKIDGFILVDFTGFKKIIDILGGITVNVEKNMYFETGDKEDGIINLRKGRQLLNGSQVLQYVRFRHDQLADISRSARQQAVLKAIVQELKQPKALLKSPWLIPQAYKSIYTNLSMAKLLSFSGMILHWDSVQVVSQTLPGYFSTENKISYWDVYPNDIKKVASGLFEQGKTSEVFAKRPANICIKTPPKTNVSNRKNKSNSLLCNPHSLPEINPITNNNQSEQNFKTYDIQFSQNEQCSNL